MKNLLSGLLLMGLGLVVQSQVQIDKRVELTGSGNDARITGIDSVAASRDAVNAKTVQQGSLIYADASGSGNQFLLVISPALTSVVPGMMLNFKSNQNITGNAVVSVNGLGPFTIRKYVSDTLVANDIRNGQVVSVIFDGVNFQLLSPPGSASGGSGGNGGPFTQNAIFTAYFGCITNDTVYWRDFYPSAAASGYELRNCLPRWTVAANGDFGYFGLIGNGACPGGGYMYSYPKPGVNDTWNTPVGISANPWIWQIYNNTASQITCFR